MKLSKIQDDAMQVLGACGGFMVVDIFPTVNGLAENTVNLLIKKRMVRYKEVSMDRGKMLTFTLKGWGYAGERGYIIGRALL